MNINQLIKIASSAGFESYGNFRTEDANIQCEIMTCTNGGLCDGEVLEIYYDYYSGEVNAPLIKCYCQFPVGHPHHRPVKFNCPVS